MKHYDPLDAAIAWMYANNYPDLMHQVAVELGYHNPPLGVELRDAPSENEWLDDLMQQYWLADQDTPAYRRQARDARIWLKSAMRTVQTVGDLVDLIQQRMRERMEAGATA